MYLGRTIFKDGQNGSIPIVLCVELLQDLQEVVSVVTLLGKRQQKASGVISWISLTFGRQTDFCSLCLLLDFLKYDPRSLWNSPESTIGSSLSGFLLLKGMQSFECRSAVVSRLAFLDLMSSLYNFIIALEVAWVPCLRSFFSCLP